MRPFLSTLIHHRPEKGPLKESADHGVFVGTGAVSTSRRETVPSGVGPGFRLSSHSASGGHENGAGIGVVGVTGVSVACVTFGESISTESSRRYAPHVSTVCPERRAGVIVQRWIDRMLSAARDGIGSRSRRTDRALPVGSTRAETKNPLESTASVNGSLAGSAAGVSNTLP